MKPTLVPGLRHTFSFTVTDAKTVPAIYPEATDFQAMPAVFATGYLVALCEWACIDLIRPHLDWPAEQSLGTRVDLTHVAATPPGLTVTVDATLTEVNGRTLRFAVHAHDGIDEITRGTHERTLIDAGRFSARIAAKAERAGVPAPR